MTVTSLAEPITTTTERVPVGPEIPFVVGLGEVEAAALLEAAGFEVTFANPETTAAVEDAGLIASQDPTGGEEAVLGSSVALTGYFYESGVSVEDSIRLLKADSHGIVMAMINASVSSGDPAKYTPMDPTSYSGAGLNVHRLAEAYQSMVVKGREDFGGDWFVYKHIETRVRTEVRAGASHIVPYADGTFYVDGNYDSSGNAVGPRVGGFKFGVVDGRAVLIDAVITTIQATGGGRWLSDTHNRADLVSVTGVTGPVTVGAVESSVTSYDPFVSSLATTIAVTNTGSESLRFNRQQHPYGGLSAEALEPFSADDWSLNAVWPMVLEPGETGTLLVESNFKWSWDTFTLEVAHRSGSGDAGAIEGWSELTETFTMNHTIPALISTACRVVAPPETGVLATNECLATENLLNG